MGVCFQTGATQLDNGLLSVVESYIGHRVYSHVLRLVFEDFGMGVLASGPSHCSNLVCIHCSNGFLLLYYNGRFRYPMESVRLIALCSGLFSRTTWMSGTKTLSL